MIDTICDNEAVTYIGHADRYGDDKPEHEGYKV